MNTLLKPAEDTTLQQQFKVAHGKLPPSELPGQIIIEQLDREIEEGEFTSFRLQELQSKEEVIEANKSKNDNLGVPVTMTSSGTVIRQQVRVKVKLPSTPEDFRRRFDLLWAGIELAKFKKTNHPILNSSSDKLWQGHVKYILAPEVKGLQVKNMHGSVAKTISWELVLHYNQEVLNKAAELVNEGNDASKGVKLDIAVAVESAHKDPCVRHTHFIDKFSPQGSGKREREQGSGDNADENKALRIQAKQKKQQAAVALVKAQCKGGKRGTLKGAKGAGGGRDGGGGKGDKKAEESS